MSGKVTLWVLGFLITLGWLILSIMVVASFYMFLAMFISEAVLYTFAAIVILFALLYYD